MIPAIFDLPYRRIRAAPIAHLDAALAREYGLEELRHYLNRSRCEIDKGRGGEFS